MPSPLRRAWGTRYDSLVDTPSSGSPVVSSPNLSLNSRETATSLDADCAHGVRRTSAEKERVCVDQEYATPSFGAIQNGVDASSPMQARMPHDASVFVASLPSHIPEAELQVLLTDHLAQHATIKHVKLIRDNRGTVCAFVQVESATQASAVIAACNLSYFVDRHIRCERARAFRTLLVSWRPAASPEGADGGQINAQQGIEKKPFRLRRCRGTKYIQVTHGSDALTADPAHLPNYTPSHPDDALAGPGLLFPEGLKEGDFDSFKSLLEAFGPLEFITPFDPNSQPRISQPTSESFTRGGSGSQSVKDGGENEADQVLPQRPMWAVKWEHRNDAVSAITALQYIPNLFVCWSHTYGRPHHPPYSQYAHSRDSSGFHLQTSYPDTTSGPGNTDPTRAEPQFHLDGEGDMDGPRVTALTTTGARTQPSNVQTHNTVKTESLEAAVPFSESDFPPLGGESALPVGMRSGRSKRGAWLGRRNFVRAGAPSPPAITTSLSTSQMRTGPNTPTSVVPHTPDLESTVEPSPITPAFPMTPRSPSGGYGVQVPVVDDKRKDALYTSSYEYSTPHGATPGGYVPSVGRQGYGIGVAPQGYPAPYTSPYNLPQRRGLIDASEKAYDGRELFIGGLDTEAWDEERIRSVFGQYGTIEEMRFVKPGYHVNRRAFAFVKYTDRESPQRAIKMEHLRIYDDRKIKVQLRDINPPKRWNYRGRGRFQNSGLLRTDRDPVDYDHESSIGEVGMSTGVDSDEGGEPEEGAHVRFASAPTVGNTQLDDIVKPDEDNSNVTDRLAETQSDVGVDGQEKRREAGSPGSFCSDGAPSYGREAQNQRTDSTMARLASVSISQSPLNTSTPQAIQLEADLQTANSTPPPSGPDAVSNYAPSSVGSAPVPTSAGYYTQTPSWIPPYAIPPGSYGHYGYYSQQISGQAPPDGPNQYPWMATLYRNVVPFVPWFNPPPGVELAPAPVRPTGYIQREPGGIFIPVYPPERLGQYMSTSSTTVDQSQAQTQPQSNASSVGNWQNLPPHPQLYPVPFPIPQPMMIPTQSSTNGQPPLPPQQQVPMSGSGWLTGLPPGVAYAAQQVPSSAPPPYLAPSPYYPSSQSSTLPANSRQYGQYDGTMHQPPMKSSNRRGTEHGNQSHRMSNNFGPRESRAHPRRVLGGGTNGAAPEQSYPIGPSDPQWHVQKNGALPSQLQMSASGSASHWS